MARSLAPVALLLMAGSLVLLWFVILSGLTRTSPLRQTYFLRAETLGIDGARPVSQWTFFRICGLGNLDCGPSRPALPLGDAWASSADAVPDELIGNFGNGTTSYSYWYMWRFGWVFYLLALLFEVIALIVGMLALCSRVGSVLAGIVSAVAFVFLAAGVSLMTATFVKMRNAFVNDGRDASLGAYAFGFSWGAVAALLIATVLFCASSRKSKRDAPPPPAGRPRTYPWNRHTTHPVKTDYA
ncbi:hypothetical protein VTJ83DRAFT_3735 [Remersonia thermophila]|uniref:Uncharacterized protein n=1 Tax=Remersonia thermophila TaxID=72144 RepID=A0ABR4DH49_9PEZI